ncbi:16S rRNA (guanine(966)-N(2))-methyltransferase RsmD [Desulfovibrio sp.]|uniref:16S rRNA (guanine(966)-N(2))-methyltransferase RsmD n=1 Tax=Desulfovibrio sp. TaxID=885 RepID=UPI0023D67665|nr:16S rRNA (guanine(966)-N(2))-methyltransferase RsmD [Desulfovibrio sp.]MDE7241326.1 16S rRNA (guanine(966)-N(2))-methyltransferase RsmD [Desulfovibrio sp.]
MRVISGTFKGRRLATPPGELCRPAMGRTREALFSMLEARGADMTRARVLDLFAGSGSLAFEALSRGAPEACLVENSKAALRVLEANVSALGLAGRARIISEDVIRFLRRPAHTVSGAPFDLVFLDPPYRKTLAQPALALLAGGTWLAPGALVAAEVEDGLGLEPVRGLEPLAMRRFGQTVVHIWTAPEAPL